MTTARRRERAGTTAGTRIALGDRALEVPAELLDPSNAVWRDRTLHIRFMAKNGWRLVARDRLRSAGGASGNPQNRRIHAAEQWARAHGLCQTGGDDSRTDLGKLRRLLDAADGK